MKNKLKKTELIFADTSFPTGPSILLRQSTCVKRFKQFLTTAKSNQYGKKQPIKYLSDYNFYKNQYCKALSFYTNTPKACKFVKQFNLIK
jgi:hypothetical protein